MSYRPWRTVREALDIARLRGVEVEVCGEADGYPSLLINGRVVACPVDDLDEELTDAAIEYLAFCTGVPREDFGGRLDC